MASISLLPPMMRAAVAQCAAAGAGALGIVAGRAVASCASQSHTRCLSRLPSRQRLSLYPHTAHSIRYASTASTSTTTPIEPSSTPASEHGSDAHEADEVAELQRLQALIKEKLAKQKQRLMKQLSPLPGEQTSGFTRRTRAQREAERAATAPADHTDSQQQPQSAAAESDDRPWQQLASPLPLRKPINLHSIASTSATAAQTRRILTPPTSPRTSARTAPDTPPNRATRVDRQQSYTVEAEAEQSYSDEPRYRRSRATDPNLNPERQAMLRDRNTRRNEQKRVRVQRRLERDDTDRVARQDDELFHDVVSPRAKVRGKGIAGSVVMAKHQRHPKGVREERTRDDDDRRLATEGSVEERMSRSVFDVGARASSDVDTELAERDRHRRQLKYAERGERGSRADWAGAGKPGRWEAREQRWQSTRNNGRVRRVGEEHASAERPRGHGVKLHPWGRSVNQRDDPPPPSSRRGGRDESRRTGGRDDSSQSSRYSWVSDMKHHASSMQQERKDRDERRDRGRGRGRGRR